MLSQIARTLAPTRRVVVEAVTVALAALSLPAWSPSAAARSGRNIKWVAFYGESGDEQVLARYDIVVLDPMFRGDISAVAASGALVCGYLSLGEITRANYVYDQVPSAALLEENPSWPGTRRVDVRNPAWRDLLLSTMIDDITAKGFKGLMLDTLDTPTYLEQVDPVRNHGMGKAAADLVRAIHRRHPAMKLIMNRGYALLHEVAGSLSAVIAESLVTTPGPSTGQFTWQELQRVQFELGMISAGMRPHAALPVLSLDYWRPDDPRGIEAIYRRQRELGHHPYVATPMLDTIVPEPAE